MKWDADQRGRARKNPRQSALVVCQTDLDGWKGSRAERKSKDAAKRPSFDFA
jgi:hypothetical protein